MPGTRKPMYNHLDCKSRFPQHRVERLMNQDMYCGLTSAILEEGAFIELTPEGLPLQQVFLGLTAVEFIVVTQEVQYTYNVRNKNDLELEGLRIEAIFPLSAIRFSLSHDCPMTFSVTTKGGERFLFEMCTLDGTYLANWNVWKNILEYIIENQPSQNMSFNWSPVQTESPIRSASLCSHDSFSDKDDPIALKSDAHGRILAPSGQQDFFFGGHFTKFDPIRFGLDCEKTPSLRKSSSWSDVFFGYNRPTHMFDKASFQKILNWRDMMSSNFGDGPVSDDEDIEKLFKEARSHASVKKGGKRSGSQLWGIVQRKMLDRGMSHVVFQAVSAKKMSIATSILECRPQEVAEELTIISRRLLLSVRPADLEQYRKSSSKHLPESLQRIITFGDSVCKLVMAEILSSQRICDRATALKFFIDVCYHLLFTQQDFQTLICVLRGITSLPVYRLRNTWATLYVQEPLTFSQFKATASLLSPKRRYRSYRTRVKACNFRNSPFIPWIDHFLVHCKGPNVPPDNAILTVSRPVKRARTSPRVSLRHERSPMSGSQVREESNNGFIRRRVLAKERHQAKMLACYQVTDAGNEGLLAESITTSLDIDSEDVKATGNKKLVQHERTATFTKTQTEKGKLHENKNNVNATNTSNASQKRQTAILSDANDNEDSSNKREYPDVNVIPAGQPPTVLKEKTDIDSDHNDENTHTSTRTKHTNNEQALARMENKDDEGLEEEPQGEMTNVSRQLLRYERLEATMKRKLEMKVQHKERQIMNEINRIRVQEGSESIEKDPAVKTHLPDKRIGNAFHSENNAKIPEHSAQERVKGVGTQHKKTTPNTIQNQGEKSTVNSDGISTVNVPVKEKANRDNTTAIEQTQVRSSAANMLNDHDSTISPKNKSTAVGMSFRDELSAAVAKRGLDKSIHPKDDKTDINHNQTDKGLTDTHTEIEESGVPDIAPIMPQLKSILKNQDDKKEHKKKGFLKIFRSNKQKKVKFHLSKSERARAAEMEKKNSSLKHRAKTKRYPAEPVRNDDPVATDNSGLASNPITVTPIIEKYCAETSDEIIQDAFQSIRHDAELKDTTQTRLAKGKVQAKRQEPNPNIIDPKRDVNEPNTDAKEHKANVKDPKANVNEHMTNVEETKTIINEHLTPAIDDGRDDLPGWEALVGEGAHGFTKKPSTKGNSNWFSRKVQKRKEKRQTTKEIKHVNNLQREIDSISNFLQDFQEENIYGSNKGTTVSKVGEVHQKDGKESMPNNAMKRKPTVLSDDSAISQGVDAESKFVGMTPENRRKSYVPASVYQNRRKSLFEEAYDDTKDQDLDDHFTNAMTKQLRSIKGKRKSIALDLLEVSHKDAASDDTPNQNKCNNANGDNSSPTHVFDFGIKGNPLCYRMNKTDFDSKHKPKVDPAPVCRSTSAECVGICDVNTRSRERCFYCGGDSCIYFESPISELIRTQTLLLGTPKRSSKRVREGLMRMLATSDYLTNYDLLSLSLSRE